MDDENHLLARPNKVPFLQSHTVVGDHPIAEILVMEAAGIGKHIIVDNFISKYGSYYKCGLVR